MTLQKEPSTGGARGTTGEHHVTSLTDLAAESPAESIARENEIVAAIARDRSDHAGEPVPESTEEQLRALVDPEEIRRH